MADESIDEVIKQLHHLRGRTAALSVVLAFVVASVGKDHGIQEEVSKRLHDRLATIRPSSKDELEGYYECFKEVCVGIEGGD